MKIGGKNCTGGGTTTFRCKKNLEKTKKGIQFVVNCKGETVCFQHLIFFCIISHFSCQDYLRIPDFELSFVKSEVLCTALSVRGSEFERDF